MSSTISREAAQTLSDAGHMVSLIHQQDQKIEPRFGKFYDGLRRGIDDASEQEIALYRPQLDKVGDEIDECLNTIQGAQALLAQLEGDKDAMEALFDKVEPLVKAVAATRKRMTELATRAREIDGEVERALVEIRKGEQAEEADLGALQAQVKSVMKSVERVQEQAPKLEQAARKAWEKKDQKALTDARNQLIDFGKVGTAAGAMRPRIEKFKKQYPDLDRERKAEVQWMLDDIERAEDVIRRIGDTTRELVRLGQVPVEEKKAPAKPITLSVGEMTKVVQEFELPTNDTELRVRAWKIFNSCPIEQWPKELAKLYGVKESKLKDRLAKVRKLPFLQ